MRKVLLAVVLAEVLIAVMALDAAGEENDLLSVVVGLNALVGGLVVLWGMLLGSQTVARRVHGRRARPDAGSRTATLQSWPLLGDWREGPPVPVRFLRRLVLAVPLRSRAAEVFRLVVYLWLLGAGIQRLAHWWTGQNLLGARASDFLGLNPTDWVFAWVVAVSTVIVWFCEWSHRKEHDAATTRRRHRDAGSGSSTG